MNIGIIVAEAIIFAIIFTVLVIVTAMKNKYTSSNIYNYPKDVQDEYFKTHEKMDVSYKSKKVILTKGLGIIIFTVILFICSYIAGAKTFKDGFLLTFILMIWIGLYDTFFIDWVLFANLKMFRLEGTEHMDKEYHQKWFHLKGIFFPGIIFAIIPSLLVGLLCTLVK